MEKSLLEKMKNGTCDDIDKAMIASRVLRALKDTMSEVVKFGKKIEELQEQYAAELKMAGFAVVCGSTNITDENDIGFKCIVGDQSNVMKVFSKLIQTLD